MMKRKEKIIITTSEAGQEYVTPINNETIKKLRKYIEKALKTKPKANKDGSFTIDFGVKYSEGQKKVNK